MDHPELSISPAPDAPDDAGKTPDPSDDDNRITNRLRASERRRRLVAMVVDDSEDIQEFVRRCLEDQGFIVHQARDGKQALAMLVDLATPALIVLDIEMPVMNGLELLDVIWSYTRLSNVPVIVVTAGEHAFERHAPNFACLKKPLDEETLATTVSDLLTPGPPAA